MDHSILIDSYGTVDDREMYRYITDEVFSSVIQDITLPGYDAHFVYGE